ncbi:MAG: VOC family protein [Nocardiaceae bacterium]|nr:VOC family protein [Nocardiaceae bacterium]
MPTRDSAWPQGTPCWVDLQVDDVAQAREFYTDLFGWDIQDGPEEAGGYLMAMLKGKAAAGIGPKFGDAPMPSVWTTYLAADSADDIAEKVGSAGGMIFGPPFDVLDVGRMFVATDPSGAPFGVWEAKAHIGAGIYNEHGAYTWNELHTLQYDESREFFTKVFGWTYTDLGDGVNMIYSTFANPGAEEGVGGIADAKLFGEPASYWLTWFQVDGLDASLEKAIELGSSKMMGPDATPFGRMAVVAGPQGEVFGLIDGNDKTAPPQ